jgi:hypothetical protein
MGPAQTLAVCHSRPPRKVLDATRFGVKKVVANQEGVVLGRQHDSGRRYSLR